MERRREKERKAGRVGRGGGREVGALLAQPSNRGRGLISQGCYNKMPQAGGLRNNGNGFLAGLEAKSPRSKHYVVQ